MVFPADAKEAVPVLQDLFGQGITESGRRSASRKEMGAYYTDTAVADFLVRWGILSSLDIVLDPNSGDGVFLTAAGTRLRQLGGDPAQQVYGVDIDAIASRRFTSHPIHGHSVAGVLHADFFEVSPGSPPLADAVVGNPPFIRYQRFSGAVRERALLRARESGVDISRLTSSWAPFLVHAVRFLKPLAASPW